MRTRLAAALPMVLTLYPLLAGSAQAGPPLEYVLGPGWQIAYALTGEMEVEICIGNCQTVLLSQPGGTMSLYLEDPEGDEIFVDGAASHLDTFEFDLEYGVLGYEVSESVRRAPGVDLFGQLDTSTFRIEWDAPFEVHAVGSSFCTATFPLQLCELYIPPTPPNPPTPIDETRVDTLSPLQFDILGGAPPDIFASWEVSSDSFPIFPSSPSFVTFDVALRGRETDRQYCDQGLVRASAYDAYWCIPEPHAGLLVAVGLVAVALAQLRRVG